MRHIIPLAAALALIAASAAHADAWCGFLDKKHSRVHCGYSSLAQCKQAIGDNKNAYCIPDPSFARREDGRVQIAGLRPLLR